MDFLTDMAITYTKQARPSKTFTKQARTSGGAGRFSFARFGQARFSVSDQYTREVRPSVPTFTKQPKP